MHSSSFNPPIYVNKMPIFLIFLNKIQDQFYVSTPNKTKMLQLKMDVNLIDLLNILRSTEGSSKEQNMVWL